MISELDRENLRRVWNQVIPHAGDLFYELAEKESWSADRILMLGQTQWRDDEQIVETLERILQMLSEGPPYLINEIIERENKAALEFIEFFSSVSLIRAMRLFERSGVNQQILAFLMQNAQNHGKEILPDIFLRRMYFLDQLRFLDVFFDAYALDESASILLSHMEEEGDNE